MDRNSQGKKTHFAENVCRRHLTAAEGHGAGGRRSDAELVLFRANGDASEFCFRIDGDRDCRKKRVGTNEQQA